MDKAIFNLWWNRFSNISKRNYQSRYESWPKRYDPKKIKRLISNAKNQCLTSNDLLEKADNNFDKTVAEAYKRYRISLQK